MKENFEEKVSNLESKVTQLEEKVKEQETILFSLKSELSSIPAKSTSPENGVSNFNLRQNAVHRTCNEVRAFDISLSSGMYWIDPDGKDFGDDPINVFCNMTTGTY